MDLTAHLNARSDEMLGALTPDTTATPLAAAVPVMATPAAAIVATAAAFAAGYAVEEAGDS